jgi:hypothetical protein
MPRRPRLLIFGGCAPRSAFGPGPNRGRSPSSTSTRTAGRSPASHQAAKPLQIVNFLQSTFPQLSATLSRNFSQTTPRDFSQTTPRDFSQTTPRDFAQNHSHSYRSATNGSTLVARRAGM